MANYDYYDNAFWGNLGENAGSRIGGTVADWWNEVVDAYHAWHPQ